MGKVVINLTSGPEDPESSTIAYLVVNLIATVLMRALERRVRVPGYVGA